VSFEDAANNVLSSFQWQPPAQDGSNLDPNYLFRDIPFGGNDTLHHISIESDAGNPAGTAIGFYGDFWRA
jgi:hypothetical protein